MLGRRQKCIGPSCRSEPPQRQRLATFFFERPALLLEIERDYLVRGRCEKARNLGSIEFALLWFLPDNLFFFFHFFEKYV